MNNRIKELIKKHAKAEAPNESCGFIYIAQNRLDILPCKNVSEEPLEAFEISEDDYFECRQLGEIIGIYHSGELPAFSPADIINADEWPLILYLYSLKEDSFHTYIPKHYIIDYLGRPFVWGHYDCYTLVKDYYRREFKLYLGDYDCDETYESSKKQDILLNFDKEGFIQSSNLANAKEGDVLLFQCGKEYHVGIYVGDNRFLHHPLRSQSRIEPIDGYWAKSFKSILKHKSRF